MYTNNEISERETREKIPFTVAIRKIMYQNKFNLGDKRPVLGNYRTLRNKLGMIQINGRIYCVHG